MQLLYSDVYLMHSFVHHIDLQLVVVYSYNSFVTQNIQFKIQYRIYTRLGYHTEI